MSEQNLANKFSGLQRLTVLLEVAAANGQTERVAQIAQMITDQVKDTHNEYLKIISKLGDFLNGQEESYQAPNLKRHKDPEQQSGNKAKSSGRFATNRQSKVRQKRKL